MNILLIKLIIILTNHQKQILDNWFYIHTKIYNETLKYIFETYNITVVFRKIIQF